MLSVAIIYSYAECHYAERRYAECRNAECRYAECRYAECHGDTFSLTNKHWTRLKLLAKGKHSSLFCLTATIKKIVLQHQHLFESFY